VWHACLDESAEVAGGKLLGVSTLAMGFGSALQTSVLMRLGEIANRTLVLPLVIFYPTSRRTGVNRARRSGDDDLSIEEIDGVAHALPSLGTQLVEFSGGDPLLRPDVFEAAQLFRAQGATLHLRTAGRWLERCAADVAREFSRVVLDVDQAAGAADGTAGGAATLEAAEEGIRRLRRLAPHVPVSARAALHRLNFRELPRLIERARAMGLDGISFLPADASASAREGADGEAHHLAPEGPDLTDLAVIVEQAIDGCRADFESGFVAQSPAQLRRVSQYYAALSGRGAFPAVSCNAPYRSVVVEANGAVRPCYFHEVVGNVRAEPLGVIVSRNLPAFRQGLDMDTNPVCARCVCPTRVGWRHTPWT
jgi:MoaA/NifB/PqqE/SkfB family radical SAM enzyme